MKYIWISLSLLAGIGLACAINCRCMTARTDRWSGQIEASESLAQAGRWNAASAALQGSYADWSASQTYLHIVAEHEAVDGAEAMYRRAAAFAAEEESSEFRAELADLRNQLRLLAEMERFSVKNIL